MEALFKTNRTMTTFHILSVDKSVNFPFHCPPPPPPPHPHPHPSPPPPPPGRWLLQAVREVGYKAEEDGARRALLVLRKDARSSSLCAVFGELQPD